MRILLNAFLLFLICSCSPKQQLKRVDIDKQLVNFAKDIHPSGARICSIMPIKTWDEIVVVGPYTTEERLKPFDIENLAGVKDVLLSVSYNEGKCMLVYLKSKKAIAYSVVSRFPVDFVRDGSDTYSFKYNQCDAILFKKEQDKRLHVVQVSQ